MTKRILCVDDDADTCDILTNLFKVEGYDAKCVERVEDALDLLEKESFDLYVLDTWLGERSGNTLCQRLRETYPQLPIIIYSGAARESDREEALRVGASAFIAKPYIDRLLEVVRRLLS
jgi:DNA-binding response OmpR family regulator